MFKTVELYVWHQDSPGVQVRVRRNWWQRLIYPACFSAIGEKHI